MTQKQSAHMQKINKKASWTRPWNMTIQSTDYKNLFRGYKKSIWEKKGKNFVMYKTINEGKEW